MRYASGAIKQVKEITFDFTFDSFSNTAIDIIHDITNVINAISVILFITAAQSINTKHKIAMIRTVKRYFNHPPLLKTTGMINAAHITPNSRHFRIKIIKASINTPFELFS